MEFDDNAWVRSLWEAAGDRYLAVADNEFGWSHLSKPFLIRQRDLFAGKRVLDLGCGNGRFADLIADRVASYVGIDWSPTIIEGAKLQRPFLSFQIGDAETLEGIGERSFDIAVALNVFQNHARPDLALKRCASVLSDEGHLLVIIEHPMRTSAIRRAWPPEQLDRYAKLGLDRAYDAVFSFRSFFLGEDTPIVGWHRPLSHYDAMMRDAGFDIVSFDELSFSSSFEAEPISEAIKRGMVGEPVFAALHLSKRGS